MNGIQLHRIRHGIESRDDRSRQDRGHFRMGGRRGLTGGEAGRAVAPAPRRCPAWMRYRQAVAFGQ